MFLIVQELGIYDIQSFDPELGRTLLEFQALVNRKRYLESIPKRNPVGPFDLYFRNTRIEDLCLDFTLPGYTDYLLTDGSNHKLVILTCIIYRASLLSCEFFQVKNLFPFAFFAG